MGVAAHAIEGREELLTLADGVGVLVKAVLRDRRLSSATSGMQITQRVWWALFRRGGSLEVPLLPLAAHEGKSETQTENQESRTAGIQDSAVSSLSCFPAFLIHFAVATCFGGSGTRGTLYWSRIASTSSRFCRSTALISSRSGWAFFRTPHAILKVNGMCGSAAGSTGTTTSGTLALLAK